VFGTGTAREWPGLLSAANDSLASPLDIVSVPSGSGPSDHASFHAAGIPVLHFFTDTHADYHRPGDDWDRIDADGLDRVIELAVGIASRLAGVRMPLTPG
jgi:Zn-dependent M28 family amino/carboxypeptidase